MANITITYRLWNSTSDQSMSFPGSSEASARFAYNALKSGGWTTAAISDQAAQKKLAELMESRHKPTSIQAAPALLSLAALSKELHQAAMKRELTLAEGQEMQRLADEVMHSLRKLEHAPIPSNPPAPKVEAPPIPQFDAIPTAPAPKVEVKKEAEIAKKAGLFTR